MTREELLDSPGSASKGDSLVNVNQTLEWTRRKEEGAKEKGRKERERELVGASVTNST